MRVQEENAVPKIAYITKRFSAESKKIIDLANAIFDEYHLLGFILTLRQLFYQFVSRDNLQNTEASYKRLGNIIGDARLAGLIDWELMEDRTRNLKELPAWDSPSDIISVCAHQF